MAQQNQYLNLPDGFIEVTLVPSGSIMHIAVDAIAAYGKELHESRGFIGTPLYFKGQSNTEAVLCSDGLRALAHKCVDALERRKQHNGQ